MKEQRFAHEQKCIVIVRIFCAFLFCMSIWNTIKQQCRLLQQTNCNDTIEDKSKKSSWLYVPNMHASNMMLDELNVLRIRRNNRDQFMVINARGPGASPMELKQFIPYLKSLQHIYNWNGIWRIVRKDCVVYAHPNEIRSGLWSCWEMPPLLPGISTEEKLQYLVKSVNHDQMMNVHARDILPNRLIPISVRKGGLFCHYIAVCLPNTRICSTFNTMTLKINKNEQDNVWFGNIQFICADGNGILLSVPSRDSSKQRVGPAMMQLADAFCKLLKVDYCKLCDASNFSVVAKTTTTATTCNINLSIFKAIKSGLSWYNQFGFWQTEMQVLNEFTAYVQSPKIFAEYCQHLNALCSLKEFVIEEIKHIQKMHKQHEQFSDLFPLLAKRMNYANYILLTTTVMNEERHDRNALLIWNEITEKANLWNERIIEHALKHPNRMHSFKGFIMYLFDENPELYVDFMNNPPFCADFDRLIREMNDNHGLIKHYNKGRLRQNRQKRKLLNIASLKSVAKRIVVDDNNADINKIESVNNNNANADSDSSNNSSNSDSDSESE